MQLILGQRLHQEHLLSLSLLGSPLGECFLLLVGMSSSFLGFSSGLSALFLLLLEVHLTEIGRAIDLVLLKFDFLVLHVTSSTLLLLEQLNPFLISLFLMLLQLILLFLEANEAELGDFLLDALLTLELNFLGGREVLWILGA